MGLPHVIADPATLIAIAWLIVATFSTLVDAFYATTITLKPLCITREATRTKTLSKTFTKRLIQFTLFVSTTLLILSTTVLALKLNTVGTRRSPQDLITPVQIRTSGREQVYRDFVRFFLRDLNDLPPAPVVMTPPVPVSGSHSWLTSSNKTATQLSSLMPMVIIYTTLLAVVSDALDSNRPHLFSALVVVVCATVKSTSRSGLHSVLVLLRAGCAHVVQVALIVRGLLEDSLSLVIYCVELRLIFTKYLVRLSGTPLLIRSVNSLVDAHARYSITSVLTQLLPRTFLFWYTIAAATLLLARLLVGILKKRYQARLVKSLAFLRHAAATALMMLAVRLEDSSSECGIPVQVPSTPRDQEATKEVIEAEKDQEGAPAVEGSPAAISPSSGSVPVDLSVFPILGTRLTIDKGPREICESDRNLLQTMMNDQRPESTRLVSIHPPSATVLAVIEDLLKDPISSLRGLPQKIRLTGSELVYVLTAVLDECNRHHQTVNDGLAKNNESAEARIRSEARKNRVLALELNGLRSELKRTRESVVEGKDLCTNAVSMGDSVGHQIEDGKTASASKLELAATPSHDGEATKALADDITSLQGLLSDLCALRNLVRAMLMPEYCSGLEKGGEVDAFNSNLGPHPRVRDLIADCDFARIEISRVISLLVVQRSADSKHKHTMLKKQQAFREELSDRVTELRKEYESQLEDLDRQLQREKVAHHQTKTFNDFYLHLHSKREHSLQEEVEKRNEEVKQLQKDIYSLRRRVKDTEALKEELFRPVDFKEWVLQWFSTKNISKATGTLLEDRYRNAMQDLDKVIAQMEVLATQSDLVNQHTELLQYICSKLFKLDPNIAAARSSPISKNHRLVHARHEAIKIR